jgi:hypothetical protein
VRREELGAPDARGTSGMATQGDGREGGTPRADRDEDSVVFSLDRLQAMAQRGVPRSSAPRVPTNFGGTALDGLATRAAAPLVLPASQAYAPSTSNTRERVVLTRTIGVLLLTTLGLGAYVALDPRPRSVVTRAHAPEPVEAAVSMEPDDIELVPDASTSAGGEAEASPLSSPSSTVGRPVADGAPRAKRRPQATRGHDEPVRPRGPEVASTPRADGVPIACVLEPSGPGCGRTAAPLRDPATRTIPEVDPSLPETLSQSALREGIAAVKASAKQCAGRHGGSPGEAVKIRLSIVGQTGAVQSTTAEGEYRGTALGNCVAAALKKANFPRFRKPAIGLEYTITL